MFIQIVRKSRTVLTESFHSVSQIPMKSAEVIKSLFRTQANQSLLLLQSTATGLILLGYTQVFFLLRRVQQKVGCQVWLHQTKQGLRCWDTGKKQKSPWEVGICYFSQIDNSHEINFRTLHVLFCDANLPCMIVSCLQRWSFCCKCGEMRGLLWRCSFLSRFYE